METFIARQAIFNKSKKVFAYEILFRNGLNNAVSNNLDGNRATRAVMVNAMLDFGMKKLVSNKKAFINFTEQNILDRTPELLPSEVVYVEILEDVQPTPRILDAVTRLKNLGYKIVLDDFVFSEGYAPLIALADIIKVDFRLTEDAEERKRLRSLIPQKVFLLAEKIETEEELQQAIDYGYSLFQGYFFCKPTILKKQKQVTNALSQLRLLKEINSRDVDFRSITNVISSDTTLVHKLLTYINSPGIGLVNKIANLRQATSLLGKDGLRRWVSLIGLQELSTDKPSELFTISLIRAKFCNLVALRMKRKDISPDTGFILGMFSLLDALTNQTMENLLTELALTQELNDALLGIQSPLRSLLELAMSYERGDWSSVLAWCEKENFPPRELNLIYTQAVEWNNAFSAVR